MKTTPPVIDWQPILLRLRKVKPLSKLAAEVHSDWAHINRLARGEVMDTKFSIAVRILDLHADHFPDEHRNIHLAERTR